MLVKVILSRNLRDRRAVALGGLTGSPDESGKTRREKGLARSGNARVRRGMIQLAWRFLNFKKVSALAKWFEARTKNARGWRKKMIVALARKLLIALWHFVRDGVVPEGVVLRPAHLRSRKRSRNTRRFRPPVRTACDGSPMTVRGGGVPPVSMASMLRYRMGPPPRGLLPMRIPASWFGSLARCIQ